MRTFEYTIKDKLGIHARPAGLLVNAVRALDSEVTVTKGAKTVNGIQLLQVILWRNGVLLLWIPW